MPTLNDLVAQSSGGQPDRLAALAGDQQASMDLVQQLVQATQAQGKLAEAQENVPGVGQRLLDPAGIASMLAALGGAATGTQEGASAGLGVLSGFMGQASQQEQATKAQLAEAQATSQAMLDSNRQRLTTMLQSRPDFFIDTGTGKSLIDPRTLGFAATGFLIPIDPAAAHRLAQQTQLQKNTLAFGVELAMNGGNPDARLEGGRIVNNALGLNLSDETLQGMSAVNEESQWNTLYAHTDGGSVVGARLYALQNNLPLMHADVLGMIKGKGTGGGKYTFDDVAMDLMTQFTAAMGAASTEVHDLPLAEQIAYAFDGEPVKIANMKKYYLGSNAFGTGISGPMMLQQHRSMYEKLTALFMVTKGQGPWFEGIENPEDLSGLVSTYSAASVDDLKSSIADVTMQGVGTHIKRLTGSLVTSRGMTQEEASFIASEMVMQAKEQSLVDGVFDVTKFNTIVGKMTLDAQAKE